MKFDKHVAEVTSDNPNMLVPWYIITALAYYDDDDPIVSDHVFDKMAKDLLSEWDTVEHRHKDFITLDMLRAGTFFHDGNLPGIIRGSLDSLRENGVPKRKKRAKKPVSPPPSGDLMDLFE